MLLVEDNPDDAELLQAQLEDAGYAEIELVWHETLHDGLETLASDPCDLFLLDLGLSDTEGIATLREACPQDLEVPVVVITGLADEAVAEKALQQGAQDYIIKGSYGADEVVRVLRYAVTRFREQRARHEAMRQGMEEARAEAEARFRRQLINVAAHELRTPITPMRFQVASLKSGQLGHLTEGQEAALTTLDRNLERMERLVRDVLDAAQLQEGALTLSTRRVQLESAVQAAARPFQGPAAEAGVTLTMDGVEPLTCLADPDRLIQVLDKLLDNAIKFTDKGGRIDVEAFRDDEGVVLLVRDNGRGMDQETLDRAVGPFNQAEDHDPSHPGAGLGLYIARQLVRAQGGELTLASQGLGEGTTVRIRLPCPG